MNLLYLSSPGGGLDTNVRVLGPALVKAGHQVSILYLHSGGESLPATARGTDGIAVYHAAIGDWHYLFRRATFGLTSLGRIVRDWEYSSALTRAVADVQKESALDLIELPEGFAAPSLLRRVPVVMRLHASAWMCNRLCHDPPALADSIEAWLEGQTLGRVRGISSPSAFVADYIREACRVKRPIQLIPYPVDTGQFAPAGERFQPPLVLFVGRVEKRKGADVLMRAIPQVLAKYPDTQFVFAGKIADDLKVQAAAATAKTQFFRFRPREELVDWHRRASLFVLPSIWDNSPNVIYEAMACGTPVVATRVGGIPELVEDGITGLLIPPRDPEALAGAIIDLLGDPARRERMGQCGREKAVALFSLDKILRRTLSFYEGVLQRHVTA